MVQLNRNESTEVIKTQPTFLEKIQSYIPKRDKSDESKKVIETQVKSESPITVKEVSNSSVSNSSNSSNVEKTIEKPTIINTVALENRLARLEYLLSNTLEVKIVD
jgi:hypothetical protein